MLPALWKKLKKIVDEIMELEAEKIIFESETVESARKCLEETRGKNLEK